MLDFVAIGKFVAKAIASHAVNKQIKRVDHLFHGPHDAEERLANLIQHTVEEYQKAHPIPNIGKKYPFYLSQILVAELLKFRFFQRDGYMLSEATIAEALRKNPNILPPKEEQLRRFLDIFEQQVQQDEQLKKLEIDENYKPEIFHISAKIDELLKRQATPGYFPKELTALTPIAKKEIVGRENDLKKLRRKLLKEKETVLMNGMGGIGKTTLAAVYVSEFYNDYDHIAWLTIENTLEEALAANYALLANLGLREVPPTEQLAACLNALRTLPGETAPSCWCWTTLTPPLPPITSACPSRQAGICWSPPGSALPVFMRWNWIFWTKPKPLPCLKNTKRALPRNRCRQL